MKKVLIILLSISLISLLNGCSIDWNDSKDKKIGELGKQIKDDSFKKKQECIKYKSEMEKDIKGRFPNSELNNDLYLQDIFYSPVKNSCLYKGEEIEGDNHNHMIIDYTNNEKIYSTIPTCILDSKHINDGEQNNKDRCYTEVINKIKELKGE